LFVALLVESILHFVQSVSNELQLIVICKYCRLYIYRLFGIPCFPQFQR